MSILEFFEGGGGGLFFKKSGLEFQKLQVLVFRFYLKCHFLCVNIKIQLNNSNTLYANFKLQILKFMFSLTNIIIYELCIHGVCPTMNKRFKKLNYCVH